MFTVQASTYVLIPLDSPRILTPARLNQKMATRSGPGTQYTEELGTLPQDTAIMLVESVNTNGTPWGMVEFQKNNLKYRAYTGMKRIETKSLFSQVTNEYDESTLSQTTNVYYGPGVDYAIRENRVKAGTYLRVFDYENGFYLCDYQQTDGTWVRAYFPTL